MENSEDKVKVKAKPKAKPKPKPKVKEQQPETPKFWTEGELTRPQVYCVVCLGIVVEPVSLPCFHSVCLTCYNTFKEVTSIYCPLCRVRLSIWSRKATKGNSLVNMPFWERIKQQFPEEIAKKSAGTDDEPFLTSDTRDGIMARRGEILEEFKASREKFAAEEAAAKLKEEEASKELIQKLQEEEPPLPPPQSPTELQADFELAQALASPEQAQVQSDFEMAKRLQEEEQKQGQINTISLRAAARSSTSMSPSTSSSSMPSQGGNSSKPKGNLNLAKKRQSPSAATSSKSKAKKPKECPDDGQPKISSYFASSPSPTSPLTPTGDPSTPMVPRILELEERTEVDLGRTEPVPSTSTASFLSILNGSSSHRTRCPGVQSRVSNSDDSDDEALLEGPAVILPGLANINDDNDTDTDSQGTNESSSLSLWEIMKRQILEETEKRKRQEESDRKLALRLQTEERKGPTPKADYKLRQKPKSDTNRKKNSS